MLEALFKSNRNQYYDPKNKRNQKNIKNRLVDFMYQQIEFHDKFKVIHHKNHLRVIIARFMKCRLFFWGNFMNQSDKKLMVENQIILKESYASKSTRSMNHPDLK